MDYDLSNTQRLWGRYTHDLSETRELGGLFFNTADPGRGRHRHARCPARSAAFGLRSIIGSNKLNELNYHFSSNNITTLPAEGVRTPRSEFGVTIPEVFPGKRRRPDSGDRRHRPQHCSAPTSCSASSTSITRSRTTSRGSAATTPSRSAASRPSSRRTRTPPAAARAASRSSPRPAAPPAFQNFLRGNATAPCTGCSYTEAERDIDLNLRFNRFEFYAQDTWRPTLAPDGRLRPALLAVSADHRQEQPAGDVRPVGRTTRRRRRRSPTPAGTLIDRTQGNLLVGIIQGGVNSPYGDGIYEFKKNSCSRAPAWPTTCRATATPSCAAPSASTTTSRWSASSSRTRSPCRRSSTTSRSPTRRWPTRRAGQTPTTTGVRDDHRDGHRLQESAHDAVERRRDAAASPTG